MRQFILCGALVLITGIPMAGAVINEPVEMRAVQTGRVCDDMATRVERAAAIGFLPPEIAQSRFLNADSKRRLKAPIQRDPAAEPEPEDPEAIECTLNISWDGEKYSPSTLLLNTIGNGYKYYVDDLPTPEGTRIKIKVRPGTYDVYLSFWELGDYSSVSVIKENVAIPATNDIEIGSNLIDTEIKVEAVWPDGTKIEPAVIKPLDVEPWGEVLSEGNLESLSASVLLVHEDYGVMKEGTVMGAGIYTDSYTEGLHWNVLDYKGSSLSSKYKFVVDRIMIQKGNPTPVYMLQIAPEIKSGTIVNSVDKYYTIKDELGHTPLYSPEKIEDRYGNVSTYSIVNGEDNGGFYSPITTPELALHVYSDGEVFSSYYPAFSFVVNDQSKKEVYREEYDDGEVYEEIYYIEQSIHSTPFVMNKGIKEYIFMPENSNTSVTNQQDSEIMVPFWSAEPAYRYTESERGVLAAESSPYLVTAHQVADEESTAEPGVIRHYNWMSYGWEGILGEQRLGDQSVQTIEIRQDGELVKPADMDLHDWEMKWRDAEHQPCTLEYLFENRNFKHDGIEGLNRTVVTSKMGQEDCNAPSLHFMTLREVATNAITDEFANPEAGRLVFAGGDFNSKTEHRWYYELAPMTVKVEYAPNGSGMWTELDVIQDAAKDDRLRGFGNYYEVSLAGVKDKSESGWFDVRFTLSDPAGNKSVQTIAPLFKIESLAGISTVATVDNDSPAEYFTLQGVRVAEPLKGNVYVVRRGSTVSKEIIR